MTPSLNKCPRCGTLRPSGEVAHTCVVRSTVPDHEAAKNWAEQIPKQATVSVDDENLSRAYLDLVARDPADTGTSREGDPYAEIAALREDLARKDAALKAQQAVVDAARSVLTALGVDDVPYTGLKRSLAALEIEQSNGK